jgi:hypothetical protein
MQIEGAVVKEQGQTFAIVVVKSSVGNSGNQARQQAASSFATLFDPGVPIILMWQDAQGTPNYWGRPDIVSFLANIDPTRIPWQRYTIAA